MKAIDCGPIKALVVDDSDDEYGTSIDVYMVTHSGSLNVCIYGPSVAADVTKMADGLRKVAEAMEAIVLTREAAAPPSVEGPPREGR